MKVLNQPNSNGGINVKTHPSLIRDPQSSLAYNMDYSILGQVSQKIGHEKVLNEISAVNASIGLGRYLKNSNGTEYIIIKVNGQFRYATPLSSAWSVLESGYSTTYSDFGDHTTWKDKIYVFNEIDDLLEWGGTGVFTHYASAPKGKYGCVYENRIFIAGITLTKSRLAWSDLGIVNFSNNRLQTGTITGTTPVVGATLVQAVTGATATVTAVNGTSPNGSLDITSVVGVFDTVHLVTGTNPAATTFTFTPTQAFSNYVDIAPDDGNEITGMKISEGKLRVYKGKGGSYTINFTDTGVPYPVRDDSFEGTIRHQTIANLEKPAIYLAEKSVRKMGQEAQYPASQRDSDISEVIFPILKKINTAVYKNTACAAYYEKLYYLAVPGEGSAVNNILLVYTEAQKTVDYPYGAWTIYTNTYVNALVYWNGYLHFCDSRKGQLYRFNPLINSDDNAPIQSVLQTKFSSMGKPNIFKKIKAINVRCFIDAGGILQVAYSRDFGSFGEAINVTPVSSGGSPGDPLGVVSGVQVVPDPIGSSSLILGSSDAIFGGGGLSTGEPIFCSFKWSIGQIECVYIALRFTFATPNKTWKLIDYDFEYEEMPDNDTYPINCSIDYPES